MIVLKDMYYMRRKFKDMLNMIKNSILNKYILIALIPFAFGLFHNFAVYIVAIILLLVLTYILYKNKKIYIFLNLPFISISVLTIGYLLTCFWAVDKNDALLGFFRILTIFLFSNVIMQIQKDELQSYYKLIPKSALLMCLVCFIFGLIPELKKYVYSDNGRLGGFFQYSNTFALFLLVGLIISIYDSSKVKNKFFEEIILLIGIFLTGSRTVFLLTILFFITYLFTNKDKDKDKWKKIILLIVIMILAFIIALITNNFDTIGRYLTISLNSSTLWGRLIYYYDAVKLLRSNLFGYGYMGYSFVYPTIQTAIYNIKFVHSDFLQIALDIGIIPTIFWIISITYSILSSKTSNMQRIILIVMFLHMLFDFNLEFLVIYFIIISMQNLNNGKRKIEIKSNILILFFIVILSIIYLYLSIATFMNYIGNNSIAINMLPNYTEAKLELLKTEKNIKNAKLLAEEIIKENKYISFTYYIKAVNELYNKNYEKMCEYQEIAIKLDKYNKDNYENYIIMLSQTLEETAKNNDRNNTLKYMNKVIKIREMLDELKDNTNRLASKIQDNSHINLNEQTNEYIKNIEGVIKNDKIR